MNKKRALHLLMDILEDIDCPQCRYFEKCWGTDTNEYEHKCICLDAIKVLKEDIGE